MKRPKDNGAIVENVKACLRVILAPYAPGRVLSQQAAWDTRLGTESPDLKALRDTWRNVDLELLAKRAEHDRGVWDGCAAVLRYGDPTSPGFYAIRELAARFMHDEVKRPSPIKTPRHRNDLVIETIVIATSFTGIEATALSSNVSVFELVADVLNELGIPPVKGKEFTFTSVEKIWNGRAKK